MRVPKPILERRRSIRLEAALPFKIGAQGYEQEAATLNISAHGAMCLIEKDVPLMTKLSMAVTVSLPQTKSSSFSKRNIHVTGVVVRKEKDEATGQFRVAIFFSEISALDQEALNQYLQSRLQK